MNLLEDTLFKKEQSFYIERNTYNNEVLSTIQKRWEYFKTRYSMYNSLYILRQARAKAAAGLCSMVFLAVISMGIWGSTASISNQHIIARNGTRTAVASAHNNNNNHTSAQTRQPAPQSQNSIASQPATQEKASQPAGSYQDIARQAAISQGIDPERFVRQIQQESGFNPGVVSPAGAIGIAQFMPATAAGLGVNANDPVKALYGAARMMSGLQQQFSGSPAMALAAYNAGPGAVQGAVQAGGNNWLAYLPAETQHYVQTIL